MNSNKSANVDFVKPNHFGGHLYLLSLQRLQHLKSFKIGRKQSTKWHRS